MTESEALKMLYDKNFTSMSIEQRDPSIIHVSTDILKMTSHCFAIQTNSSKRTNKKKFKVKHKQILFKFNVNARLSNINK